MTKSTFDNYDCPLAMSYNLPPVSNSECTYSFEFKAEYEANARFMLMGNVTALTTTQPCVTGNIRFNIRTHLTADEIKHLVPSFYYFHNGVL